MAGGGAINYRDTPVIDRTMTDHINDMHVKNLDRPNVSYVNTNDLDDNEPQNDLKWNDQAEEKKRCRNGRKQK